MRAADKLCEECIHYCALLAPMCSMKNGVRERLPEFRESTCGGVYWRDANV